MDDSKQRFTNKQVKTRMTLFNQMDHMEFNTCDGASHVKA